MNIPKVSIVIFFGGGSKSVKSKMIILIFKSKSFLGEEET